MYPSSDSLRLNSGNQNCSDDDQAAEIDNDLSEALGDGQESNRNDDSDLLVEESVPNCNEEPEPQSTCHITPESDYSNDFSFAISEDSLALPENVYVPIENTPSTSYSNSRELHILCEDSTSHDPLPACLLFGDSAQPVGNDYFANIGEESSMDSGLGSVESVYPNSEDDAVASPIDLKSEDDEEVSRATSESTTHVFMDTATVIVSSQLSDNSQNAQFMDTTSTSSRMKRHIRDYDAETPHMASKIRRKKKKVNFQDVTVFYFPRKQGFVSVPSQGGSTLGMAMNHSEFRTMPLSEYHSIIKERHKAKLLEHMKEQTLASEMLQFQYINQGFQRNDMPTVSQSNFCSGQEISNSVSEPFLDSVDEYFFLQPISAKKRRKILRSSGVERIDGEEKLANRVLRESREMCGCSCQGICVPESCECSQAGIQCQVDRESFPCGCVASGCQNENGRIEFNPERVRIHWLETLKKFQESGCEESEGAAISDSEQSTNFSESEDGSCVLHSESEVKFKMKEDHTLAQQKSDTTGLPDSYLKTLQLERVDHLIYENMESNCISSEYTTPSGLPSISSFDLFPLNDAEKVDEPCLGTSHSTVNDFPCKTSQVQGLPTQNCVVELSPSNHMFSPSVELSNVLNEPYLNVRYDRTLSLDPIDTFMTSSFITSSASDVSGTLNFSTSL